MSWFQQPNNSLQAAEAEADADVLAGQIGQQNRAVKEWRDYAENLQKALNEARLAFVNMSGAEAGQAVLKEAALAEIAKLDPSNKLLDPTYRKTLYDAEMVAVLKRLQK